MSTSSIAGNSAGTDGGGIFNHAALGATAGLAGSAVAGNLPDNCAPPGAVSGCAAMTTTKGGTGLPAGGAPRAVAARAVAIRAEAPRRSSPPVPAAGADRPLTTRRIRGPGSPPGTWPLTNGRGCYTPRSAIRRPEEMAALKAWKSRSFWSAYAAEKSAIAFSNTSDPPR